MSDSFAHENAFYLTCPPERIGKLLAQYELFRMSLDVPGEIVECGVFKGASLARWAMFRELFCLPASRRIVAFDTFERYFDADTERDDLLRERVVSAAGEVGISVAEMESVLARKGHGNVELIAGDIRETVPGYVRDHPELRISLLNVDVDFAEATETILRYLYPRLSMGGVLVLDDYATFEGETVAVEKFLPGVRVRKFAFAYSPCYVVKG